MHERHEDLGGCCATGSLFFSFVFSTLQAFEFSAGAELREIFLLVSESLDARFVPRDV